jgi:hypothetical protein
MTWQVAPTDIAKTRGRQNGNPDLARRDGDTAPTTGTNRCACKNNLAEVSDQIALTPDPGSVHDPPPAIRERITVMNVLAPERRVRLGEGQNKYAIISAEKYYLCKGDTTLLIL